MEQISFSIFAEYQQSLPMKTNWRSRLYYIKNLQSRFRLFTGSASEVSYTQGRFRKKNAPGGFAYLDEAISSRADFTVVSVMLAPPRSLAISCTFSSSVSGVTVV